MRARFGESAWFAFALLGVLGLALYLTAPLNPVARMVPLVVAVATLAFVTLQAVLEIAPGLAKRYKFFEQKDIFGVERLRERARAETDSELPINRAGRELSVFAWVALMLILIFAFGFLIAAPLFLFLYLKLRSRESLTLSLIIAAASLALLYFVFIQALRIPLYEGMLWNWLMR